MSERARMLASIPQKECLTVKEIADIMLVAPRVVTKWIDSERLRGYRVHDSSDSRRVRRDSLIKFINTFFGEPENESK